MKFTKKNRRGAGAVRFYAHYVKRFISMLFCVVIPLSVFAQKITVTGTVYDSKSETVIGANVLVKGTKVGTITDYDGKFTIEASATDVLVVSYIGMNSQEVTVGTTRNFKIILTDNAKALEEVVVVGYGSVKRKDLTTSVSTVSTKDIAERPIISAASAIQGKAAGVTVVSPNGEPGAGMVVRIRGNSSISASNDPLYVVDGVPMGEINFLSPNDRDVLPKHLYEIIEKDVMNHVSTVCGLATYNYFNNSPTLPARSSPGWRSCCPIFRLAGQACPGFVRMYSRACTFLTSS